MGMLLDDLHEAARVLVGTDQFQLGHAEVLLVVLANDVLAIKFRVRQSAQRIDSEHGQILGAGLLQLFDNTVEECRSYVCF